MNFMQNIGKEIKFGSRNSKFLILAAGLFFFALLDPVMTKVVLPAALKSQFPNMAADAFSALINTSQTASVKNYMGDVFEIGTIIVAFTLCGVVAQELKEKTMVLPVCSGKGFGGIVLAKFTVFGVVMLLLTATALLADYAYAGALMGFDQISWLTVLRSGLLQGLYMVFILSCLMAFGAFLKRPIAAGIATLAIAYGSSFIGDLLKITQYLPMGLMKEASLLSESASSSLAVTMLISAGLIAALCGLTVLRLKKMELNGGN